jgi:3-mercaptopyruvate sulfurtransferase SseA
MDAISFLVSTQWLADELGAPDLRLFDCTVFLRRLSDWVAAGLPLEV